MTPTVAAERLTAPERREQILEAAVTVFAERGYEGASTEVIARMAGISQPYLFRLFGTKRDLIVATVQRCFVDTEELFTNAAHGRSGEEALAAMGEAYVDEIRRSPLKLRAQLQSYAACDDPAIRSVVATGFGGLVSLVGRLTGANAERLSMFFAQGMLLNVLAMMGQNDEPTAWASRLIEGCKISSRLHE
ncbi:MAG TPA: TetR/AcrR family transcriptional regulator [Candidatus Dormibacteraeota bacterium]|jgi:AcrR family transcriptional regulator